MILLTESFKETGTLLFYGMYVSKLYGDRCTFMQSLPIHAIDIMTPNLKTLSCKSTVTWNLGNYTSRQKYKYTSMIKHVQNAHGYMTAMISNPKTIFVQSIFFVNRQSM